MPTKFEHTVRVILKDSPAANDDGLVPFVGNPCAGCAEDQSIPPEWAVAFVRSPEFEAARRYAYEHSNDSTMPAGPVTEAELMGWARNIAGHFTPQTVAFQFWQNIEHGVYRQKYGSLPGSRFQHDPEEGIALFEMVRGADGQMPPDAPCATCDRCSESAA